MRCTTWRGRSAILTLALFLTMWGLPLFGVGTYEEEPIVLPVYELDHSANRRLTDLFGENVLLRESPLRETRVAVVEDVLVDFGQGAPSYLILRFVDDTILDSDELYPVPFYLFEEWADGPGLVMLVDDPMFLENMPTLEQTITAPSPQETQNDRAWGRWRYTHWQIFPDPLRATALGREDALRRTWYRHASAPQITPVAIERATELLGISVRDPDGEIVGQIDDMVINVRSAQILLVNLRAAPATGASEENYLIPLTAFVGNRRTGEITYDIDRFGLTGPSGFTADWPDIEADELYERLARFWDVRDAGMRYGIGMQIVPVRTVRFSTFSGYDLFTRDARGVGQIVDALIGPDGSLDYVIAEFGATLGFGGERTVVPVTLLGIQVGAQGALLATGMRTLDQAPVYDPDLIVNTGDPEWNAPVDRYWNNLMEIEVEEVTDVGPIPTVASLGELPAEVPLPAAEVMNFAVTSADGEQLGTVSDVELDFVDSRVAFVVLDVSWDGLFAGAEVPVPLEVLGWDLEERTVMFDMDADRLQQRLEQAPGYDDVPFETDLEFLQTLAEYWETD
jgi:sporulation protein YlmC with PRC-barrel domain